MAGAARAAGAAAPLTREDLHFVAQAALSSIRNLRVTFSYNMTNVDATNSMARSHQTVVVDGSKFFWDHEYGRPAAVDSATFHRVLSYDGTRTTSWQKWLGQAVNSTGPAQDARRIGVGFFDVNMLNQPQPGAQPGQDHSLVTILASATTKIRPRLEEVDGRWCHVAEVPTQRRDGLYMTIWIDAERGALPVRQVFYDPQAPTKTLMEFRILDAVKVTPTAWVGVHGWKRLGVSQAHESMHHPNEWVLEVDGWAEGKPDIAVNQQLAASQFEVWRTLPTGTMVIDNDAKRVWTVGGTDYEKLAQTMEPIIGHYRLRVPERSGAAAK